MLIDTTDFNLPSEYLQILRRFNGGEGELALEPMWLQLWDTQLVVEQNNDEFYREEFPKCFFFGSNGGGESLAIRYHDDSSADIVMIDCIAGLESATIIAKNFDEFEQAIGIPYED